MTTTKGTKNLKSVTAESTYRPIRLKPPTFKKLQRIVDAVNKKDFGRRIKADAVIDAGLSLISIREIELLRRGSMSNADRLEAAYRSYAARDKSITKDAFLGMLLDGAADLSGTRPATPEVAEVYQR